MKREVTRNSEFHDSRDISVKFSVTWHGHCSGDLNLEGHLGVMNFQIYSDAWALCFLLFVVPMAPF